jgi:RNA polymerase sigma-70 factor (sigma-E family)
VGRLDPAFAEFAAARYDSLLRFALVVSGDRDAAQDLVQTALLRTGLRWQWIRRQDDPEAYVRKVIIRTQLNTATRIWARETYDVPEESRPDPGFAVAEDRSRLWSGLLTLPLRQRAIVVLRYLYDQSEQQTAEQLRCSVGTVKSQCSRGLARLRAELDAPAAADSRSTDVE